MNTIVTPALCLLCLFLQGMCVISFAKEDSIDLFTAGKSNNTWSLDTRVCYRIPSLIKVNKNMLIAFAAERLWSEVEPRPKYCSDESPSNIVSRRSEDGGLTWGEVELVYSTGEELVERHPWTLYDSVTQRIFVFTNTNVQGCHCDVEYKTSDDFGVTWSQSTAIDSATGYYGMSLAHGITHTSGRLVGCMRKICRNSCDADYHSKAYFSDDHGISWATSDWLDAGTTECQLIELPDERLYLNSRPYTGWEGEKNVRLSSYSDDRGSTWSPVQAEPNLIDFNFAVEGGMTSDVESGILLFLHPFAKTRRNMTLYQGVYDQNTKQVLWDTANTIQIYGGLSEYSDVVVLNPDLRTAGVMFERTEFQAISFAVIHL